MFDSFIHKLKKNIKQDISNTNTQIIFCNTLYQTIP